MGKGLKRALLPAGLFALSLLLLQAIAGRITSLPLHAFLTVLLTVAAGHILPWAKLLRGGRPGSLRYETGLWVCFLAHFIHILREEASGLLIAWRLSTPRRWRRGYLRSLAFALADLFHRTLARTERFYAALLLKGLG